MKSTIKVLGLALVFASPTAMFSPSVDAQVNTSKSIQAFQQVRQHFPAIVSELEADCQGKWLQHKLSEAGNRLYFTCWDPVEASGFRTGFGLGGLPLSPTDQSFKIERLTCAADDEACQTVSARLRSQFPEDLEAAELKCAVKSGRLFFFDAKSQAYFKVDPEAKEVNLRCGFQAYHVTDENGDGMFDHESSAGIDIPVLTVQLQDAQNINNVRTTQQQEWDAFFNSSYTYWDAKVLSKFWNQNVGEAKARIGRKLLWGPSNQAILDQFLVDARVQALQSAESLDLYAESSYDYDDAQALAEFWGDSTPYEAKLRIERNLVLGNEQVVKDALQFASNS